MEQTHAKTQRIGWQGFSTVQGARLASAGLSVLTLLLAGGIYLGVGQPIDLPKGTELFGGSGQRILRIGIYRSDVLFIRYRHARREWEGVFDTESGVARVDVSISGP
jgi:hypothetical protein